MVTASIFFYRFGFFSLSRGPGFRLYACKASYSREKRQQFLTVSSERSLILSQHSVRISYLIEQGLMGWVNHLVTS